MATSATQPRLNETASMVLSWLRTAVPTILQNAAHPVTRKKKEQPVPALLSVLQDAVVLADVVSMLDPMRIPPAAVMRSTGRGVMSSPLPVSPAEPLSNIDARQLHVQYKNNTRRIVDAVKKLLPDVRRYARVAQHPPPGAVDAFVGNVADIPPAKDMWPAIHLAELVIACAVYGPRHNHFRHSLWRFPTEIVRTTFYVSMASVARAVCLPPPEDLYKAGPPPSQSVMSPHTLPPPVSHYSPHLSPLMHNPVSPGFSPSSSYMLSPAYIATPQPINTSHAIPTSTSPHVLNPPPYHGYSPRTPVHGPPFSPQQYGTPQHQPRQIAMPPSPHAASPRAASPRAASPRAASPHAASPHAASPAPAPAVVTARKRSSKKSAEKHRSGGRSSAPRVKSPARNPEGLVGIAERHVPDAPTSPLDATALQISTDDGIGGRKLSLVTEDSGTRSREISPLPDFEGTFQKVRSRTDTSDLDDFRNMSAVTEQGVTVGITDSSKSPSRGLQALPEDPTRDTEMQSGKSSEEFFTPNESMSETESQKQSVTSHEFFVTTSAPSAAPPESGEFYSESKVDEVVRQSVSTSIAEQVSPPELYIQNASFSSMGRGGASEGGASEGGARMTREAGRASSLDFTNPAFGHSPSFSDAPSPSNQWQVPRAKGMGQEILSPQTLFSPPLMPQRLGRGTTGGHGAPRPAPKLFRSGASSPQLSVSSAGTRSNGDAERGSSNFSKRVVESSTNEARTSRSRDAPSASRPFASTERHSGAATGTGVSPGKGSSSFSLPPSASESSDRRRGGSGMSSPVPALVEDSQYTELGEVDDSFLGRDPMATPQNVLLEPLGDDDDISAIEEALSDRAIFQRVEEVLVNTLEYRASQDTSGTGFVSNTDSTLEGTSSGRNTFGRGNDPREDRQASRGSSARQSPAPSPKTRIEAAGSSASRPPAGQTKAARTRASASASAASSTLGTPEIRPSAALPPLGPDASSPAVRPSSRKPPMYSTPIMSTERRRSVPPTPPSPPSIETLIKKFSDQTPPPESVDNGNRPISTMEPSADLFQKLISVWQSSDEESRDQGSVRSNILDGGLTPTSALLQPSGSGSQDSTLPSGDTEVALGRGSASVDSSKNRRPRAVRLPDKSLQIASDSLLTRDEEVHSKGVELHEGASVGSYGDLFPDDKDRALMSTTQVCRDGDDQEESFRGDTSGNPPSHGSAAINTISISGSDAGKVQQRVRAAAARDSQTASSPLPSGAMAIDTDGHHVRVDKRRLDWLTQELLSARDAISRKELQMTFAETQRLEQQEILLLEKQDAESVVEAMKRILTEREQELKEARHRLSATIQNVSTQDRSSLASKTSMGGVEENLGLLIREGHAKLHTHIGEAESKQEKNTHLISNEMQSLRDEVQRAMIEKMVEMTEKRDMELELLRKELESREKLVQNLQVTSSQLVERNRECEAEASEMRLENLKATHRYELEMSHVTAQVELVNEFSKKLHDNFRETENLRQQVLHYQDKLSHITGTTGVSQRQIKELREAVTRANDECARLRREADLAKKKGWEAIRRAEELEDLRIKDEAAQVAGRYPERRDGSESASYQSHEPARSPRHRGGGPGRYGITRTRGVAGSPTPAQKAWLVIKDKIGGIVAAKDVSASRRRGHPPRRDPSRTGTVSQTSQTRSRNSNRDDDIISRSTRSRSSNGSGGTPRSNNRRMSPSPSAGSHPYMHSSPHSRGEGQSVRAAGF